jgi:threonine aldolase
MGGAMRQAGIIAAACIYALDHHVERLSEDHDNAKALAEGLATIPGVVIDPATVETNLVFFELAPSAPPAPVVAERLAAEGVRIGAAGQRRMRAVTHLDVDRAGIEVTIDAVRRVLAS